MAETFNPVDFRQALADLPLSPAWSNLVPPKPVEIHLPQLHSKVLLPEVSIVVGMRGAGKSFWTAVLADKHTRELVFGAANIPRLSHVEVKVGFGLDLDNEHFPTATQITSLIDHGCTPDDVWRSVLIRYALKVLGAHLPFDDQVDAAALWVAANRAQADRCLAECDRNLEREGKILLLLFDSLERLANDWVRIRELLTAALQLGLECCSRRAIRCKFFLRPDMVEEDDELWRFADSSKLLHAKGELIWRSNDLFGLILLHLANSPSVGPAFRQAVAQRASVEWREIDKVYPLPRNLTAGEQPLRWIVEELAGSWMGSTAKRGFTFTWIPTHLSDAKGRLSPRSILLAFRHAAEWTEQRHPGHKTALHFEGIQQGVVEASKTRINEIKEDYPWVGPLLEALRGATVPLTLDELTVKWTERCIKSSLEVAQREKRLPPRRYCHDPNRQGDMQALVDDLVDLAVLYRTEDGRINMPDIFRVGFGIKRKGGVKPPH